MNMFTFVFDQIMSQGREIGLIIIVAGLGLMLAATLIKLVFQGKWSSGGFLLFGLFGLLVLKAFGPELPAALNLSYAVESVDEIGHVYTWLVVIAVIFDRMGLRFVQVFQPKSLKERYELQAKSKITDPTVRLRSATSLQALGSAGIYTSPIGRLVKQGVAADKAADLMG